MNRHLLVFHLIALTMHLVKSEVDMSEMEILEKDDDMLQCFNVLACENGKFYEFKDCLTIHLKSMEEEFITKVLSIFAPGEAEDNYEAIKHGFCAMDPEKQKKKFDDMLAEALEQYMIICDGQDFEACEDYKNAFECEMTVIEKGTTDGFCNL